MIINFEEETIKRFIFDLNIGIFTNNFTIVGDCIFIVKDFYELLVITRLLENIGFTSRYEPNNLSVAWYSETMVSVFINDKSFRIESGFTFRDDVRTSNQLPDYLNETISNLKNNYKFNLKRFELGKAKIFYEKKRSDIKYDFEVIDGSFYL